MNKAKQIEKAYLSKFDELNTMTKGLYLMSLTELLENVENVLIAAYKQGTQDVIYLLDDGVDEDLDITMLSNALNRVSGGMTYVNRLVLGYADYSEKELERVITSEYHRMYNAGAYDMAMQLAQSQNLTIMKEWHTVGDDRVRETHSWLEGYRVAIDEPFYVMGDEAMYPGDFENPDNNCNCRCWVEYSEL